MGPPGLWCLSATEVVLIIESMNRGRDVAAMRKVSVSTSVEGIAGVYPAVAKVFIGTFTRDGSKA
eukprot:7831154-Lingulodinium_polyedra.AAC.1